MQIACQIKAGQDILYVQAPSFVARNEDASVRRGTRKEEICVGYSKLTERHKIGAFCEQEALQALACLANSIGCVTIQSIGRRGKVYRIQQRRRWVRYRANLLIFGCHLDAQI